MGYELYDIFPLWGWMHILLLLFPAALIVIFHFLFRKSAQDKKRQVGIILSIFLNLFFAARTIDMIIEAKWPMGEIVPLQLCHLANIAILLAFIFKNKYLFAISWGLFLPANILTIIFPNTLNMYESLLSIQALNYIVQHTLLAVLPVWALMNNFFEISLKDFIKSSFLTFLIYICMFIFANIAIALGLEGVNWFYTIAPVPATPLQWFYDLGQTLYFGPFQIHPIYLVCTMLFAIVVMGMMYGIYLLVKKVPVTANL